ncbi:hypothetical protein CKAH01_04661 [Colletotrichum kahawae]|uniref:Uncharacterized protein n=1 Tax=Colletotrichum kahawae TaxID=34407 RepID=A0AAD9YJS4_COLKA|nr:hypothetical protein CKAH01_04661 [Colletotrichum kahawae]
MAAVTDNQTANQTAPSAASNDTSYGNIGRVSDIPIPSRFANLINPELWGRHIDFDGEIDDLSGITAAQANIWVAFLLEVYQMGDTHSRTLWRDVITDLWGWIAEVFSKIALAIRKAFKNYLMAHSV